MGLMLSLSGGWVGWLTCECEYGILAILWVLFLCDAKTFDLFEGHVMDCGMTVETYSNAY